MTDLFPSWLTVTISHSWPWYVVRAAGLMSVALLTLLVISGIGLVTGYTYRVLEPLRAWAVHRALGIALAFTVALHVIMLLFDRVVSFSIPQILIPFSADYKPVQLGSWQLGSLWVSFGILSLYGLALIIGTSLLIIDRQKRIWKYIHYLSYVVMGMIFFHALFLGTDLAHGWLRIVWIAIGIILLLVVVSRLWRARTIKPNVKTPREP